MATVQERVEAEFDCPCSETRLVKRTCSNKAVQFVRQCIRCGKASNPVAKSNLSVLEQCQAPEIDRDLQEHWEERRRRFWKAQAKAQRTEDHQARLHEYQSYLASPEWQEQRQKRLAIDRGQCRAQMKGCLGRAAHVHHKSYDLLRATGEAPMWDLVSVCARCHSRLHAHMTAVPEEPEE